MMVIRTIETFLGMQDAGSARTKRKKKKILLFQIKIFQIYAHICKQLTHIPHPHVIGKILAFIFIFYIFGDQ